MDNFEMRFMSEVLFDEHLSFQIMKLFLFLHLIGAQVAWGNMWWMNKFLLTY